MKHYEYILFDLDGTLLDTASGVADSVCYALEHMGIPLPEDKRSLTCFVGPPLAESFATFYHLSPEEIERAIAIYRVYYTATGMWDCSVYPGIPALLQRLNRAGKRLLVATSKPEKFAVPLLERFGLAQEFELIAGADADGGTRSEKHQVIAYGLDRLGITDTSRMIMVGDRKYDVLGAAQFGIDTIGVLFGFGNAEELQSAGAIALAATPEQVGDLLLGNH